jgi:hypothetical protein
MVDETEACFIVKGKDGEAEGHNAENPEAFSAFGVPEQQGSFRRRTAARQTSGDGGRNSQLRTGRRGSGMWYPNGWPNKHMLERRHRRTLLSIRDGTYTSVVPTPRIAANIAACRSCRPLRRRMS